MIPGPNDEFNLYLNIQSHQRKLENLFRYVRYNQMGLYDLNDALSIK
jgi:hypothetical protein